MFRLLFVLAIISFIKGYDEPYDLIPVTTPILQEELFEARLYHEIWTTIHFVNIRDLEKNANQINIKIKDLREQCHKFNYCIHMTALDTILIRFGKIERKINSLLKLSNNMRQKRGLFNIVGTVNKFLFGTMSADDAERIDKQIDDVYNNTGRITVLLNNQTAVMKSTLSQFKNITADYNKNMKIITDTMNVVINANTRNTVNNNMMEYITDLNLHIDDLLEEVDLIYDSINDAKIGIVSPRLISPKNFIDSLHEIHSKLFYYELPFPLEQNYYVLYMKISKINIILSGEKLIYVIHTPIPTALDYTVYKFTPIPMSGSRQYYMFDNIKNEPVAVDKNLTEYTVIDVNNCIAVNDLKICEITSVVHRFTLEESCYVRLIKYKDDKGCSRKYFNLHADFVLALSNGFSWYILPFNTENILITCGVSKDTILTINKPCIFQLNSSCRGYSQNHKYLPKSHVNITKISEYKINIEFLPIEKIAFNTSDLKLPTFTSFHVDTSEILNSAKSIQDITKDLELITSNHNYHTWMITAHSIFHYVMYAIATIAIFYILHKIGVFHCFSLIYKFCIPRLCPKCFKCQNNNQQNEESVTMPMSAQRDEENTHTSVTERSIVHYNPSAPMQ